MGYLLYGRRTGLLVKGKPVHDKTYRALNYQGVRVNRLAQAGEYATKEDALEKLNKPWIQDKIEQGLLQFDVRKC